LCAQLTRDLFAIAKFLLGVKSNFFIAFLLNYVMMSTTNKIRDENPASTGSLAGSKQLTQKVRDQVCDKKSRKHVANPHERVDNLATNLVENQVCSQLE